MSDSSPRREADGETDADGVDRTLIREMLALSPDDRLRRLEQLVEMIQRIRDANGFSAVP
ncbi:MAG: hypothetical protein KC776_37210 [Myxococcales bacterium]|nr:hypothetical protein [Myxococcales bacterium]MCB9578168.1 hypothetical protein [Polyangiaceae bacterium]